MISILLINAVNKFQNKLKTSSKFIFSSTFLWKDVDLESLSFEINDCKMYKIPEVPPTLN